MASTPLIKRSIALLLLCACLQVYAKGYAQITLSETNAPLQKVFKKIQKQSGYDFLFSTQLLQQAGPVTVKVSNVSLQKALEECLKGKELEYEIQNQTIIIKKKTATGVVPRNTTVLPPPPVDIQGRITDSIGNPIAGATVSVKGTGATTQTNSSGEFVLKGLSSNATLVISSIGFETKEVHVGGLSTVSVQLNTSAAALKDVVVTALGITREKRGLTYSTQEIKGAAILKTKEPNVLNALAGQVSGAQITSSSGAPGSSTRIIIRGPTSVLGDNEALIVVDGVPINNAETGALTSGAGSSRIIDIDPSTIENVNILKGAAATALYGSSGARGVVIITTRSGGINKKPVMSLSSSVSWDKGILPKFQDKYAQGIDGEFQDGDIVKSSASWGPLMDTLKINGKPAPKYDPRKLFFQTGLATNNTISLSGGNNNSGYYISYSYFNQKGIVPSSYFKRNSLFVKYNSRITDKLTSTFQLTYTNSDQRREPEGATFGQPGPIFVVYNQPISWNPFPIYNPDGTQRVFRNGRNNPYWDLQNVYNKYNVNRFISVLTFNYQLAKWLTVSDRLGGDIFTEQDNYKESPSDALNTPGTLIDNNINFRQFNNDLIISANRQFRDFNINLILGNNVYSSYSQRHNIQGVGLAVNDFDNIMSAATITASNKHYLQRKVGFYAQANIDYKKFLVLSATGRYDGSSVLATDHAFYPYGSVGANLIFSELLSPSLAKVISFGKLRVSYASVGNDNVGVYSLQTPYVSATINNIQFPYHGQGGFLLTPTLGNANLRNERLNEFEVGGEVKLLNNRISVEGAYFSRRSVDGIIPGVSISAATGFSGTTVNSARISNKGFEFLVAATAVRSNNFSWNISANFTKIRNKVVALYGDLKSLGRIVVGQPYNIFFGTRFSRTAKGEVLVDAEGLPILDDTPGIIGDANPDWLAGLTNTFFYKRFSLSFFVDIKKGGDVYNSTELNDYFFGTAKSTENRAPIIYKGINIEDNKPNTVQVSAQDLYRYYSDIDEPAIQDASFIKLRNVTLGYDLNKQLFKKSPFRSGSLTLTGRNLWIHAPHFTSGDPEGSTYGNSNENQGVLGYAYPSTRSFIVSLKLDF